MTPATRLACGIKDVASAQKETFTTTQAVWRFLNNEKISFSKLNQPILELANREIKQSAHTYALMIHDWSHLKFVTHKSKKKILKMSHHGDLGYELQSSLLVDAANGLPIVPISQSLTDNDTRHSTLGDKLKAQETHMDALTEDVKDIEGLNLGKLLVHIIDREGDSIAHMRELSSHGYNFLIRGKGGHTVEYQGKNQKLNDVADSLSYNNKVTINYKGKKAYLSVSEATITLTRMAKPKRFSDEGKRISPQLGKPLPLRLVVSKVSDKKGNVLARWMLLSNVLEEIKCDELARWYYWRWTIESFFKLIKSAGHNVESWLQKSAKALLRRLIIASMACVLVWRIQRAEGIQNAKARKFLCRLSGRPQKRGRRESAPAILAGLSVLLNTIQLLSEYSAEELSKFTSTILGSTKYV